jgi:type I restriction enzyme S subunit
MSELNKLLEGVEVGWSTLGDEKFILISNSGRSPVKASDRISGKVPYYGANNIQDYVEGYTHNGEYVLVAEDGTQSLENYSIQWAIGKFWANNHVHVISGTDLICNRFIFHYLRTVKFIPFLSGGGRAKLTKGKLVEIPIPIPPLPIQKEIVHILDTFTELTTQLITELTTELTARKKQYNYYREQLLSFADGEVEWKTLDTVFNIFAGGDVPKEAFSVIETEEFNIPILSNGINKKSLYGWTNIPKIEKPSLTISARGTIGWTSYRDKPFFPIVRLLVLTPKIELNAKFAFYYMKTIEDKYNVPQNGIPQLTKPMVKDISFPIPSLEEQNRVVTILDTFDTLTTSISEGLPKEIALRKKQYEYYRDRLLTFPKKEA